MMCHLPYVATFPVPFSLSQLKLAWTTPDPDLLYLCLVRHLMIEQEAIDFVVGGRVDYESHSTLQAQEVSQSHTDGDDSTGEERCYRSPEVLADVVDELAAVLDAADVAGRHAVLLAQTLAVAVDSCKVRNYEDPRAEPSAVTDRNFYCRLVGGGAPSQEPMVGWKERAVVSRQHYTINTLS